MIDAVLEVLDEYERRVPQADVLARYLVRQALSAAFQAQQRESPREYEKGPSSL